MIYPIIEADGGDIVVRTREGGSDLWFFSRDGLRIHSRGLGMKPSWVLPDALAKSLAMFAYKILQGEGGNAEKGIMQAILQTHLARIYFDTTSPCSKNSYNFYRNFPNSRSATLRKASEALGYDVFDEVISTDWQYYNIMIDAMRVGDLVFYNAILVSNHIPTCKLIASGLELTKKRALNGLLSKLRRVRDQKEHVANTVATIVLNDDYWVRLVGEETKKEIYL